MTEKDFLKNYRQKRDFDLSSEPFGGEKGKENKDQQIFVIQKHEATHLHFDFRLLIDGVLKSWAVPKGPSTDPKIKRLAIRTEDHPVEYADFEGVIPQGQYGGGTVMVWDSGTFKTDSENKKDLLEQLEKGKLSFYLEGHKLKGGFSLIKMKNDQKNEQWLLFKTDDEHADAKKNPAKTLNKSVLSGRTMEEIEKEENHGN